MTRLHSEHILDLAPPLTWLDYAIEWVLAALLLFTPMAFGTMEAWSQQIFFAGVTVMVLLMTARLVVVRQSRFVWTWAYVPIVAYLLLVALSIIPLPAAVLNVISPGTVSEKSRLLADLPDVKELTATTTISFNARSTAYGLRILLALAAVFVVVINTFRTAGQVKRLLGMIVIAGAAVTLLALAQDLTYSPREPTKIFWHFSFVPSPHYGAGPFIGHAQMGQYLNLVIGAAIALALVQIGQTFQGEDLSGREIFERLGEPGLRVVFLLVLLMAMAAGALVLAASRGAWIGFAVASLLVTVLLLCKRGWRQGETARLIAVLAGIMLIVGAVFVVLAMRHLEKTVETASVTGAARVEILKKIPSMIARWPVMGTGLESFEWVYPMFQTASGYRRDISDHAENDYAQTLTDTGVVGFALVAAFVGILVVNWVRARRGRQPIHLAAIGIAFALTAVMVHETADFAQRTPAIGLLTTLLIGITFALSRLGEPHPVESAAPKFGFNPLPRLAAGLAMTAALAWALWSNHAVYMGEKYYYVSDPLFTNNIDPYDPKHDAELVAFFNERIAGCEQALRYDPDSMAYRHYLNEFRWRLLSRRRDPETWNIVWPPDAAERARNIVDELSAARVLCPTFGRLYILQGMVQWSLLDKQEGKKNLLHGYELMPIDGEVNYNLTEVALDEGRWDDAVKFARETMVRHLWYDQRLVRLVFRKYKNSEVAFRIFEGDPHGLVLLSRYVPKEDEALHRRISERSIELLREAIKEDPRDGQSYVALAGQLDRLGRKAEAADAVALALRSDYANVDWRLYRARLLRDLGRRDEALAELDIVRRIRPNSDEAKALQAALVSPRGR